LLKSTSADLGDVGACKLIRRQQHDVLVAHVAEYVVHVGQRIGLVQLTALDQAVIGDGGLTGRLGNYEEKRFSADGDCPRALLGMVVVGLEVTGLCVPAQPLPILQGVLHSVAEGALREHGIGLDVEPAFEGLEDRDGLGLALLPMSHR
jgi:hypothetical protein